MRRLSVFLVSLALFSAQLSADEIDFVRDVRPIFQEHCYGCHGAEKQKSGLRLDIKSEAFKGGDGYGPSVVAGSSAESPLIELVASEDEDSRMPPEGDPLSKAQIDKLRKWIDEGAKWPDGVDLATVEDRLDHWAFKPSMSPAVPRVRNVAWPRGEIDRFILSRLELHDLSPSDQVGQVAWLRRATLDLTGLPPTPSEVEDFVRHVEREEGAYAKVVDRLLNSPRYGERWAQHWLDVVRYADTHGFEVNTERPNAWPYRDYVIDAFNRDTPYDQFVKEQIVGDAMDAGAATGFLVTASVLLPGQIGKDAASKRLARQDSLDEIVNNIGQTFLGLSVGCARCHDHKFDPIEAKDYYSMQAFVAGVEYADRKIQSAQAERLRKETLPLRKRVAEIKRRLANFVPMANPGLNLDPKHRNTDAGANEEVFASMNAKFVRLTIHDANLHPSLGLIEPCIDELEIYTDEPTPRNIALASLGTKVTASGSRESASHKLTHINDGKYGNSSSWMSATRGQGWVLFELPKLSRIGKIVWGRDRLGQFTDRLATAYTLEAGETLDSLTKIKHVSPLRPAVKANVNIDRIQPVRTKRLRFTVLATNRLEPCIDELEVFTRNGNNVALAEVGTRVRTSGDNVVAGRHEPEFLNDGKYGNSHSWMSSVGGKGWVELEFASEQDIVRVVWGRDREGKFSDRLATQYRIEVSVGEDWKVVADSRDRYPWDEKAKRQRIHHTVGLSAEESKQARLLMNEKRDLEAQIKISESGQLAFAGKFRTPDDIFLLRRGDPEQPGEKVSPAVLRAIGELSLDNNTPEQHRRVALANWIVEPGNPLTARVMVNRIWQWHFGVGLVETANDFGRNGAKPSHPQLLDWLAQEFIQSGWSIKHMHRLIMLSATYRQSSSHNNKASVVDADDRLLWRYPSRRLEAESIRDSMLAVSGQLNLKMGGRGFDLFNKRGGLSGFKPVESFSGEGLRRMVYAHRVRRERDAVFGAFDCPDAGQSTPRRIDSTTPIQALNLFNSKLTIDQAKAFADRVQKSVGDDIGTQIDEVYRLALNRTPSADEVSDAEPVVSEFGLATLCRVLFNSNEFLFLP